MSHMKQHRTFEILDGVFANQGEDVDIRTKTFIVRSTDVDTEGVGFDAPIPKRLYDHMTLREMVELSEAIKAHLDKLDPGVRG